ncbi:MAG: tRNA uridine-5-carboxymethylaminomethyl(34) synthesis GTPase MnmE [Clostridia bacterium]|nr:tRNA uridine-5-carboxymethylaminomethyl(34) synthesis GTPase MnmE [Clostridia bacterium]
MQNGVIAAISTPPGKGGVAVIRLSGEGAVALAESAFFPISGKLLSSYPARMQVYGRIIEGGEVLDDCLCCRFEAGSSYTGEETVELSIHGGVLLSERVLSLLFSLGASPAEPGEFTRTAFINGRLTLTEVEAIGDLLEAKSDEQLRLASETSRERLKNKIESARRRLEMLLGSIYARIDYPEEDLGELSDGEIIAELTAIGGELDALIASYKTGRAIKEGISTALVGAPNAGKSTLYNLLVGEEAAIVTDRPGTTRDLLERVCPLGRVLLRLTDTAGVRGEGAADPVERIGIERTHRRIGESELIIALFDLAQDPASDGEIIDAIKGRSSTRIALFTKCDKGGMPDAERLLKERFGEDAELFSASLAVSALCEPEATLESIKQLVERLFTDEKISTSTSAIVSSARQHASLTSAKELIDSALRAFGQGAPADCASSDIELCLARLGEVDGRAVSEAVVRDIFSRFCVGK